jgi:hypothetical protein
MCIRGSNVYFAAVKAEAERRRDAVIECILIGGTMLPLLERSMSKRAVWTRFCYREQGLYRDYLYQSKHLPQSQPPETWSCHYIENDARHFFLVTCSSKLIRVNQVPSKISTPKSLCDVVSTKMSTKIFMQELAAYGLAIPQEQLFQPQSCLWLVDLCI